MRLVLQRSPDQEAALRAFLDSVQDPRSPNFRKFLTPEQFGSRFGVSDSDVSKVTAWLRTHGLQVAGVNKGRTALEFSGTVGQLQEAFQVPIHTYVAGGVRHWANAADPSIPAALAPVIAGISNLNDIKPHGMTVMGPRGTWNENLHRIVPNLTIPISSQSYLFVTPGDAATIYDTPTSLNTALAAGQTQYDGTGVTIGVVGDVFPNENGVIYYRATFGLPSNHWTVVHDGDEGLFNPGADQTEAMLDSEVSGGIAPGANIIFYAAGDTLFQSGVMLAIYRAIDDNNVGILSVSYGECESDLGPAGNLQLFQAWEQAAAQGIAVTVSSGDAGSAGCDNFDTQQVAKGGLAVSGFASTPYNVAVGGTDFDKLRTSFSTYVSSTNSGNYTSALKYIPENPWNDSTSTNGALSSNTPTTDSQGQTNIVAGSGGASSLGGVNGSGNSIPYAKPQWQQNFSSSDQDSVRDLPDVSLLAGNGFYNALWAVCEPTDCTGGSQWSVSGVGGTSASAPAFAGMLALVNQKIGASTRLGQPNWVLYALAKNTPSVFHQITSGNNSVFCQPGSPNCNANDFLSGFNAGGSYNLATGLGSVDASSLVNNWSSVAMTSTTTTLTLDQTSFVHGTPVNVTAAVSPTASTGSVAIVNNSGAQPFAVSTNTNSNIALSNGTGTESFAEFPGGTYNVYATYGGDGSHAGSTSQPVAVTVSPENSVLRLLVYALSPQGQLVSASGQTFPLGTFVSINAEPIGVSQSSSQNPVTNATGVVYMDDSYNGAQPQGSQIVLDSSGNAEWNDVTFPAGTHSISATYNGDLSYNSSTSPAVNFTISPETPSISVSSNVSTIFSGAAILTASISAPMSPVFPMYGTVTFTDTTNNTVLGTSGPIGGCTASLIECEIAVINVNVNQFAMGNNQITASYSGDTNFTAAGPSPAITINCTAGCGNASGQSLSLAFSGQTSGSVTAGQSITAQVDVAGGGGFTGAVNLTCSVTGSKQTDIHIPTCSFNPAQVSIATANGGATSTLSLNTTAATTSSAADSHLPWKPALPVLAVLVLGSLSKRRGRIGNLIAILLFVCITAWVSGCGGSGSSSSGGGGGGGGAPGTSADTYTVTFKAVDAATGTVTAQDYFNFSVH